MIGKQRLGVDLDELITSGAIRLEITDGIPTWEASPSLRHQAIVYRVQTSIEAATESGSECKCVHFADISIRFKDGSLKRPDIAIFCISPPMSDDAVTIIPAAVVEVVSPGYEYKDLQLNPHFYLSQGVLDVVVVDPRSGLVTHHRTSGTDTYQAPITVNMQCGCQCTVPEIDQEPE